MIEPFQTQRGSRLAASSMPEFPPVRGRIASRTAVWLALAVISFSGLAGRIQAASLLLTKIVTVPSSSIAAGNGLVLVSWTGGTAPFQVQSSINLGVNWQDVDGITYAFNQTNILVNPSACFRVVGVAAVIAASADRTAPSAPTGLAPLTASSAQINLAWNASTDPGTNATGVKGYNVYRNGIFLKQVAAPGTSTSDTGLLPSSTNFYSVSAVDFAYNQSARSGPVNASTPASGSCSYSLSFLNASFPSAGGASNLVVTTGSGCTWAAVSGASWITITSGANITGTGAVGFSVSANTNSVSRTNTMTVAGQTVTVVQAAAADTTPPSVTLTAPSSGSVVSNTINLTASASDSAGIAKVEFYRDGTNLVGTATAAPFGVPDNTTSISNGLHSYAAKAYDTASNSTMSSSTSVTVSNTPAPPPTGTCLWSQYFSGTTLNDAAYPAAIKEDTNGNAVVVGVFQGSVNFGGGSVTSTNGQEMFIVKYDASGNYLWSRQISSSGGNQASGVAIDSSNNIVVAGSFAGTMDFGAGPLTSAGSSDVFVAKFAPNGTLMWARRFGGSAIDGCSAVTLDATNNIILTGKYGYYGTGIDFGGGPLPLSSGGTMQFQYDVYVAKLSPAGNYIWAKGYGGLGNDQTGGLAVDSSGNVLVTGGFQNSASFGGATFTNAGGYDFFVAKYSGATGAHIWSFSGGGTNDDSGNAVAIDPGGNVVITGVFRGTANVCGSVLSSPYNPGLPAMFVAKLTSAGTPLWSEAFIPYASFGSSSGNSVAVDGTGNIVLTGFVSGAVQLGASYLGNGDEDILLAKLSASGGVLWAKSYGSQNNDVGAAVSIGAGSNILATGYFAQTVNFGSGQMQSSCTASGFVVKTTP